MAVQVFDKSGQPLAHIQVNQQWIDPIEDGIVGADSTETDERGFATFPARVLRNRLLYRIPIGLRAPGPDANIFVCWDDQFGDANWDPQTTKLPDSIVLHVGYCPYG